MKGFVQLLSPIAPHIAEELWQLLGNNDTIAYSQWPTYDESKLVEDEVELVVQVNGKVRDHIKVARDADKETVESLVRNSDRFAEVVGDKEVKKIIVVPNRIVNIVVGK